MSEAPDKALSDLTDFVRRRIEAVPVDVRPFPHIVVQGVFPDEYYRSLLAMRPDILNLLFDEANASVLAGALLSPPGRRPARRLRASFGTGPSGGART